MTTDDKQSAPESPNQGVYDSIKYLIMTATVIGALYALALLGKVI